MRKISFVVSLLIFCAATSLMFVNKEKPVAVTSAWDPEREELRSSPTFMQTNSAPVLSASSIFIVDLESGKTLYEKNPDLLVPPASTTKIMTALTAIDSESVNQIITVPLLSTTIAGQKMHLLKGERISFEGLMYGLLVYSGNDAAEALARTYSRGRQGFISDMNAKSKRLGLSASVFNNPTGLDGDGNLTTAREMAILGKYLMDDQRLRAIVGTEKATVYSVDLKIPHYLGSTNELLATTPGVLGIKTGWTEEARENLVTYIDRGHPIIISLFGSDDRFGETKKLIDWIYGNYSWN